MGRNKKEITAITTIVLTLLFFSFTLKNDGFSPLKKEKINLVLNTIFAYYANNTTFQFSFNERVYIPFLEKWNNFSGNGYYQIKTNKFNIFFNNKTRDHYICNGKNILYTYFVEKEQNTQEYPLKNNWLLYLFPSKNNWEIFNKKIFINEKNEYLFILTPNIENFPLKRVEFIVNKENLNLKEILILGNDGRILYFNIKKIKKVHFSQKKLNKLFLYEK